jgi:flagellar basal-body rod protein FlgB
LAELGRTIQLTQQALAASWLRHQVIANNIANANTPEFQGSSVQFESLLSAALAREEEVTLRGRTAHPRHIPFPERVDVTTVRPRVVPNEGVMRVDGNTVDPEQEMALLAANQLWYSGLVRSINDQLQRYRTAINEGRR